MTGGARTAPRFTPDATTAVLFAAAGVAWVVTIAWAADMGMGAMPGTMGLNIVIFVVMWGVMMAAMMLGSVWPFVAVYSRTVTADRPRRLSTLAGGYVSAWTATGLVAYGLAWTFGRLADGRPGVAQAVAVATFAGVGLYQLTPLKLRCLSHCRSPLAHLLHYAGYTGSLRDLRAGWSHGLYCLGCCWALMVLMVAFGVMNVPAMVGLALVIGAEKMWRHGERFARVVGWACLAYTVALVFEPGLAPGLDPAGAGMTMGDTGMMGGMTSGS